jgi:hypothetical protein
MVLPASELMSRSLGAKPIHPQIGQQRIIGFTVRQCALAGLQLLEHRIGVIGRPIHASAVAEIVLPG